MLRMGSWRFLCGVLSMVLASGLASAQSEALERAAESAEEPVAPVITDAAEVPEGVDDEAVEPPAADAPESPTAMAQELPPVSEPTPEPAPEPPTTGLEFLLRADQPGLLRFETANGEAQEFRAPGRATLEPINYQVTWVPSGGTPELLQTQWRPNGETVRVAHRGPSFANLLGYWLLGNGLLVGVPVSAGIFVKRDDLGAAATFSIIGINTLVAIAGAILMGVGDDEVIELESN
jgi:hypothetical protein